MSPHCCNWALCLQSENESRMAWYSDLTCLSRTCFPLSTPPRNKKNGPGGFTWGWWWGWGVGGGGLSSTQSNTICLLSRLGLEIGGLDDGCLSVIVIHFPPRTTNAFRTSATAQESKGLGFSTSREVGTGPATFPLLYSLHLPARPGVCWNTGGI